MSATRPATPRNERPGSRYVDTPEHRAAVYSLHSVPEMREWAKQDFLAWLDRHDNEVRRLERES